MKDLLIDVLLTHAVPDVKAFAKDVTDGLTAPTALEGVELSFKVGADGVTVVAPGSSAKVVTPDVDAGSAVIHIIDTVLLPTPIGGAAPAPAP